MPSVKTLTNTETKIPRPQNCFFLYRSARLAEWKEQSGGKISQAAASQVIAKWWENEDPEVRSAFMRAAEEAKVAHAAAFPGYKYTPRSKASKAACATTNAKAKAKAKSRANKKPSQGGAAQDATAGPSGLSQTPLMALPFPFPTPKPNHGAQEVPVSYPLQGAPALPMQPPRLPVLLHSVPIVPPRPVLTPVQFYPPFLTPRPGVGGGPSEAGSPESGL